MLESPAKRITPAQKVRFENLAKTVTPLKGVLKKPEVIICTTYFFSFCFAFCVYLRLYADLARLMLSVLLMMMCLSKSLVIHLTPGF